MRIRLLAENFEPAVAKKLWRTSREPSNHPKKIKWRRNFMTTADAGQASFPVGFANYRSIREQDASAVAEWAAAGMTLAASPEFGAQPEDTERMRAILDAAAAQGIRVILCHCDACWSYLTTHGEGAYRNKFAALVGEWGAHPAVFGFNVGDEPCGDDFSIACQAIRIQREIAPQLAPFCNLAPWWPGGEARVGYTERGAYLDAYARQARPPFLCYDFYAQMRPGIKGVDEYFTNLRYHWEAARRAGIPFWTVLLSVGHFDYRCPTEDDLRWQLNTAVAHGAKGVLWFHFYTLPPHDNYRLAPIDEHGERTATFTALSRVNRTFLKWIGPTIVRLDLQSVNHVGTALGGWPAFAGAGRVLKAQCETGLTLSEFADETGRPYLAVVNNSQRESAQAHLTIRGARPTLHRVSWESVEVPVTAGDGWTAQRGGDQVLIHPWLAPGQLELYRIEDEL
jgi:hypothetical protein